MTCITASDLSLLETLEQKLSMDVSVSLLAEIERELLRLRFELSGPDWTSFCAELPKRRLFQTLRTGALTLKRLDQSCGPADVLDVMMADSLPARPSIVPSPAHLVNAWEYSLPASRSVRARKVYFAHEIAETIRTVVKPRILILGGGRLREAEDAIHSAHLHHAQFIALERDTDLGRLSESPGEFDLIYSPSWLDFSDDGQSAAWLVAGAEMLRPGGRLLAANFTPGSRDAGWMEACWNLHPHYRSEEQLAELAIELKCATIRGHAIFRDESGASAFLEVHAL